MTALQSLLKRLQTNLNILQERAAKWAGNAPLELLNQITDHQKAIHLTRQALAGEMTTAELYDALRPLLVDIRGRTEQHPDWGLSIGDVSGGIVNSIIAGRDVNVTAISTGGGAYIGGGGVNTGGGDFVGRDKNVTIGGREAYSLFKPVYQAIETSSLPAQDKADLTAEVQEIEAEVARGDAVDESFLARRLRGLKRMAPDIAEITLAALSGPGAVVSTVVKRIAERVKASTE